MPSEFGGLLFIGGEITFRPVRLQDRINRLHSGASILRASLGCQTGMGQRSCSLSAQPQRALQWPFIDRFGRSHRLNAQKSAWPELPICGKG